MVCEHFIIEYYCSHNSTHVVHAHIFVTARILTWRNFPLKIQANKSLVYFPALKNNWNSKSSSSQRVFCKITMHGHCWNASLSIQLKPNLKTTEKRSAEQLDSKLIIWLSCKGYFHVSLLPTRRFECTRGPCQLVIPWLSLLHLTLSHSHWKHRHSEGLKYVYVGRLRKQTHTHREFCINLLVFLNQSPFRWGLKNAFIISSFFQQLTPYSTNTQIQDTLPPPRE